MKKQIGKFISMLLTLVMLISMCPLSSFAADSTARIIDKDGNELGVYQYFSDALRAVQLITGKPTVILDKNVNIGGTNSVTQGDFILDLNGCTITSSDFATPFDIGSGVKVKIIDSGEDGKIVSNYAVAIDNEGDLTLEDGTITGKGGVINGETGYFQVYENGTVQSKSLPAIENSGEIYVGGNVTSTDSYGVKNKGEDSYSEVEGYVSGISAVYNVDGFCGLHGGEIVGTAGPAIVAEGGSVDFYAIENISGTDPEGLTGTVDGEFTADIGENAVITIYSSNVFPNGIVFHGRTINECLYEDVALYDENDNVVHLADDATSVEGFVRVMQYRLVSVQKTGASGISYLNSFEEAVDRAVTYNTGAIITLHDDISLDDAIEIPSGIVTIDLNGNVMTSETGTVFNVGADADVTIKDSKEDGTIECTATDEEGSLIPSIINYGTLTVDSGNFTGNIASYGDIVFNGGTYGETDLVYSETATITVNGGTFEHLDLVFDEEGTFSRSNIVMEGGTFTTGIKTNVGSLHYFTGQTKLFFDADGEQVYTPSNTSNYSFYATIDEFIAAQVIDADGVTVGNYSTVELALSAAFDHDGSTVKMINDTYMWGFQNTTQSAEVTLDLNGKTITYGYGGYAIFLDRREVVFNIKDSAGGGMLLGDYRSSAGFNFPYLLYIKLAAEVNIYGGTILRKSSGTTTKPEKLYAIINDSNNTAPNVLNIYGGRIAVEAEMEYSHNSCTIFNEGTLNIYGGEIYNDKKTAIESGFKSTVNVYGGRIASDGGCAVYDREDGFGGINIYGGTVSGATSTFSRNTDSFKVYGGYFPRGISIENRNADDTLYLKDLLAEDVNYYDINSEIIDVADDQLSIEEYVEVREAFVARVTDGKTGETTHYKTFEEALAAAQQEGNKTVLTLLEDVTLESPIEFTSGIVTIDLNGNVMTSETGTVFNVGAGADVTIKDSRENGTIESTATDEEGSLIPSIINYGTLTVDSGNFTGNIASYGDIVFNGGTFGETDLIYNENATVAVNGGTFEHLDLVFDKEGTFSSSNIVFEGGTFVTGIATNIGNLYTFTGQTKRYFYEDGEVVFNQYYSYEDALEEYVTVDEFLAAQIIDANGSSVGYYSTVDAALKAAFNYTGSTVKVLTDHYFYGSVYSDPGEVTLDLNGKTIKIDAGYYGIWLNNKDMIFNIKDSVGGGMILSDSTATAFCNFPYPVYAHLAKELNIYSGTIMRYYDSGQYPNSIYALYIDGPITGNAGVVNIYGGRIAVESSKTDKKQYAIYCNERLNIYGGQIDSNSGTAIYVDGRAAVNVYGGTITSANGYAFYDGGSRDEINIYGGTVSGAVTFSRAYDSYTLYSGYFPRGILIENRLESNVLYLNDLLAEGVNYYDTYSEKVDVADDQLSIEEYVEVREAFVARVTDGKTGETTHYKTFEEALAAAQQEGNKTVLTLLEDVTLESPIEFTSGTVTLDLNGKTILQPDDDHAVIVSENANVIIIDSIGTGEIITEAEDTSETIVNSGWLNIDGGKIQGSHTAVKNNGTLNINGGEFVASDVSLHNYSGDAKINGGIFKADVVTDVYMLINGGNFQCETIKVNDEWVEIKNGTFDIEELVFGYDASASLVNAEFVNGVTVVSPDNFHSLYGFRDFYSFFRDENGEIISLDYDEYSYDSYIKISHGASLTDDAVIEIKDEYIYGDDIDVKIFIGNIQLMEGDDYTLNIWDNNTNAGTQTMVLYGINGIDGYVVTDIEIVPREVEISWYVDDIYAENIVIPYDGNSHTLTASFLDENWSVVDVEVQNSINTDAGTYTATVVFDNPNYTIKEGTEQVAYTITPKAVDIIWSEETRFEYDGNAHSVTAYYLDINGERVDAQVENGTNTNAGEYTATAVITDTNYVINEGTQAIDYEIIGISVVFDKTEANISPENPTVQITATVTPEDASDKSLVWESDNEDVAVVDENGLVTYVGKGTAVITATTVHGNTASCTVRAEHVCNSEILAFVESTEADCFNDGNIAYYVCTCGKLYLDFEATNQITAEETVIPALAHPSENVIHTEPTEATCTEDGNTEYWTCSLCNKLFSDEECTVEITLEDTVIGAKGHDDRNTIEWTYDSENHYKICSCGVVRTTEPHGLEWITDEDATCTSDGAKHEECTVCGYVRNENTVIEKLGHSLQMTEATQANCTENGNIEYWTCSVCGKLFSDEDGINEISLEDTIVEAKGHDDADELEWANDGENHFKVCSCGEALINEPHDFEWVTDADPTCTSDGAKHEECTVCGYVRNENTVIEKLGHSLQYTEATEATCTEEGNIEYWSCSVCGKIFSDEDGINEISLEDTIVEATGHDYISVVTPPTLDEYGYTTYTCSVCAESYVADYTDPLGPVEKITIEGEITSYLSDTDPITVTLQKVGSEEVHQVTLQGNNVSYVFESVTEGIYTLTVSKNKHVARSYEIIVEDTSVTQDVKIHLIGDVNGDGRVNTIDTARANAHARGISSISGYEFECLDVNGDDRINTVDVARVNAHARGITTLW